jgi:hypothetical protein
MTQSTGHAWVLHGTSWVTSDGHAAPPFVGGVSTARVWFCSPPPHVVEHTPTSFHGVMTQSPGHGCVPHATVCVRSPMHVPPPDAGVATVRVWFCVPPPHDDEQMVALTHAEKVQLMTGGVHADAPAGEDHSTGQSMHPDAPVVLAYVPAAHATHASLPGVDWCMPTGHAWHVVFALAPVAFE